MKKDLLMLKVLGFPQSHSEDRPYCWCGARTMNEPHNPSEIEIINALGIKFHSLETCGLTVDASDKREQLYWDAKAYKEGKIIKATHNNPNGVFSFKSKKEALINLFILCNGN